MNKKRFLIIIVITILIAGNIYFALMYSLSRLEFIQVQKELKYQEVNEKVLYFAKLFINKVLLGEGEVDFEDRLKLENAVRDVNDQKIFEQWQVFVGSQNSKDVQTAAGRILDLLFDKVSK